MDKDKLEELRKETLEDLERARKDGKKVITVVMAVDMLAHKIEKELEPEYGMDCRGRIHKREKT
jgi:hypothetical protein